MIPEIGQLFKVTFLRYPEYSFLGVIISINIENLDGEFVIKQTQRISHDVNGNPYSLPDGIIEVEKNWFNSELTDRRIKLWTKNL